MKVFLFLLMLMYSTLASAQVEDSVRIRQLEKGLEYMSNELYACHKQFRVGTYFIMGGSALTVTGVALTASDKEGAFVIGAGSLLTLIGGFIHIDSHRRIGWASELELKPDGIKIIRRF